MPNIPSLPQLAKTPARKLVANTQLWLEAQRRDLPAAAVPILRTIGGQLDALAAQLDKIDEAAPAVAQVRALVGEHLPAVVSAYIAVPVPLRGQSHAGASPDAQLVTALQQISREITSVTRQLAEGALDRLAIETRFLEAKWGESAPGPD